MTQSFISSTTLLPNKLGEIYAAYNYRLVGEVRWNISTQTLETQNLSVIDTPVGGGAQAISQIPTGTYSLSAVGNSLWVKVKRSAGTGTVLGGDIVEYTSVTQPTPRENWIQLAYRNATDEIVMFGGFIAAPGPKFTKIGAVRSSDYDFIVGSTPEATHSTIQAAVNAATDGNRILVLEGTYSLSSIVSWTGKTLTIEGEGWSTVITNGAALARAFNIVSSSASVTAMNGNGSRILNMRIQGFAQTVQLDGGAGLGIRNCAVDLWTVSNATYTAPAVIGTGTSEGNEIVERVYANTGLTPNNQVRRYLLSDTQYTEMADVLMNQTLTVNGSVALGTNTAQTVQVRSPSSGYGIIPLGGIIATSPGLAGAYICGSGSVPDANGFIRCDGLAVNDPGGPMHGVVVPNMNNGYYMRGTALATAPILTAESATFTNPTYRVPSHQHSHALAVTVSGTTAANTGGATPDAFTDAAGAHSHSHAHTHNMGHNHSFDHTHNYVDDYFNPENNTWEGGGGASGPYTGNNFSQVRSTGSPSPLTTGASSSTNTGGASVVATNSAGDHSHGMAHSHSMAHSHTASLSPATVGSTTAATNVEVGANVVNVPVVSNGSVSNILPQYVTVRYCMRVR